MEYYAVIKEINPDIEEEMVLEVDGHVLTCFVNSCPFSVSEGNKYLVDISVTILDDCFLEELSRPIKKVKRIDDSFSHIISGIMEDNRLQSIITFDDDFFSEYQYLDGQYVELKVDRITADFIR